MVSKKGENTALIHNVPTEPRKPAFLVFFRFIRTIAVLATTLMGISQLMIFARASASAWLQNVLRVYVIVFCLLFVSSEFRFEDKFRFLPALRNWIIRGFLYSFIAVIGYEEATTVKLDTSGKVIPDHIITFMLKLASWIMFGTGVLYATMGIFCMNKVNASVEEQYRHDREVLQRYGNEAGAD